MNVKVNKRRKSITLLKKSPGSKVGVKKKDGRKVKSKKDGNMMTGVDMNGFDGPINKTSKFQFITSSEIVM